MRQRVHLANSKNTITSVQVCNQRRLRDAETAGRASRLKTSLGEGMLQLYLLIKVLARPVRYHTLTEDSSSERQFRWLTPPSNASTTASMKHRIPSQEDSNALVTPSKAQLPT
ncbi:hypothetical protein EVAR_22672_1 [Eumeta japonica]|uniref:Uncharacterized protein n=1 Tax=Eumeta variegata TaxID=151549 RepID=A0A4C1VNC7_EUMVA|nr:hypothetical protein EVAR_22672_1 [Eumeta japonica]